MHSHASPQPRAPQICAFHHHKQVKEKYSGAAGSSLEQHVAQMGEALNNKAGEFAIVELAERMKGLEVGMRSKADGERVLAIDGRLHACEMDMYWKASGKF